MYLMAHKSPLGCAVKLFYVESQVPSPTYISKSQHGGKVPIFEPQEIIKIWLVIIKGRSWLFYAKNFTRLVLTVGSRFLLDPTLNTSPEPHLQKVLPCGHPCHTWDPMWSGKSQLPCSQQLSNLGLGTWDPCEPVLMNKLKSIVISTHYLFDLFPLIFYPTKYMSPRGTFHSYDLANWVGLAILLWWNNHNS